MVRLRIVPLLLVMAACTSGVAGIQISSTTEVVPFPVAERAAAPSLEGEDLFPDRPAITPSSYAGKVTVIHFWGSWCGPCRNEEPVLEALWKRYRSRGVQMIGVNTRRDQRVAAQAFWQEFTATYPSIFDPSSALAYRFGVRFMPVTFVLDKTGKIAARIIGPVARADYLSNVLDSESLR